MTDNMMYLDLLVRLELQKLLIYATSDMEKYIKFSII